MTASTELLQTLRITVFILTHLSTRPVFLSLLMEQRMDGKSGTRLYVSFFFFKWTVTLKQEKGGRIGKHGICKIPIRVMKCAKEIWGQSALIPTQHRFPYSLVLPHGGFRQRRCNHLKLWGICNSGNSCRIWEGRYMWVEPSWVKCEALWETHCEWNRHPSASF